MILPGLELTFLDCPADEPNPEDPGKTLSVRLVEDDPVSAEAVSRAQSWIDYCRANHLHCLPNEDVPLPTRVLDVRVVHRYLRYRYQYQYLRYWYRY
jgi:hypothetical protein